MLHVVETTAKDLGLSYYQQWGSDWMEGMGATRFNLAPRGYGRSSFRFAE